jgi:hypothetical protein
MHPQYAKQHVPVFHQWFGVHENVALHGFVNLVFHIFPLHTFKKVGWEKEHNIRMKNHNNK